MLSTGCSTGREKAQVMPGVTALAVTVHAESKSGWQDPRKQSDYAGLRPGEGRAFETIDYTNLDEIVVWIEPVGAPGAGGVVSSAGNISINLGMTRNPLLVAGRGSIWDFRNATGRVEQVFLRTEQGRVVNLGAVHGPGRSVNPDVEGLVEVLTTGREEPVARVFVAPSAFVRVVSAGRPATFVAVPPGPARVTAWHARLPGANAQVNLEAGKTAHLDMTIGVNSLPKVP